jgi:hypothetical protein
MNKLQSAARKFGLPMKALDIVGRKQIQEIVNHEVKALPIIISKLKRFYDKGGIALIKQKVVLIRDAIGNLKALL